MPLSPRPLKPLSFLISAQDKGHICCQPSPPNCELDKRSFGGIKRKTILFIRSPTALFSAKTIECELSYDVRMRSWKHEDRCDSVTCSGCCVLVRYSEETDARRIFQISKYDSQVGTRDTLGVASRYVPRVLWEP